MEAHVEGSKQLAALIKRVKVAGSPPAIKRDLYRELSAASKPLPDKVRAHALATLPRRGGLGEWIAASEIKTSRRTSGLSAAVRITARRKKHGGKGSDLVYIDRGTIRHPVHGRRTAWVAQRVRAGWFTDPLRASAPAVRAQLVRVIRDYEKRLGER